MLRGNSLSIWQRHWCVWGMISGTEQLEIAISVVVRSSGAKKMEYLPVAATLVPMVR